MHATIPTICNLQSVLRWFLVFTKPSRECTAQVNLERQGYRVYYPRLLRPSLYRGRWVDRVVSLFPRYLFVQLDLGRQSISPVRSTVGVANIVRFGQETAFVPEGIVDALFCRADPESGLHRLNIRRQYQPGSRVSVIAGAFEGLEGIFEREAGEDRAIILLKLLGRNTPVLVRSGFVVPITA